MLRGAGSDSRAAALRRHRVGQQNGNVKVLRISLPHSRSAEIGVVGPDDGDAVLYFHSPSTSGEELEHAASAAEQLQLRLLSVQRPSIACDEPEQFVETVAEDIASVVEVLALNRPAVLGWSGGAPYSLATSARLGPDIASIHLVSPVPGPLTGPTRYPTSHPGSSRSPTRQPHRHGSPVRPHFVTTRRSQHPGRSMSGRSRSPSRSGPRQRIRSCRSASSSISPGDCPTSRSLRSPESMTGSPRTGRPYWADYEADPQERS